MRTYRIQYLNFINRVETKELKASDRQEARLQAYKKWKVKHILSCTCTDSGKPPILREAYFKLLDEQAELEALRADYRKNVRDITFKQFAKETTDEEWNRLEVDYEHYQSLLQAANSALDKVEEKIRKGRQTLTREERVSYNQEYFESPSRVTLPAE